MASCVQAQRAAEDVGKKLPGAGDVTSGIKNAVPALPKVRVSCMIRTCLSLSGWDVQCACMRYHQSPSE